MATPGWIKYPRWGSAARHRPVNLEVCMSHPIPTARPGQIFKFVPPRRGPAARAGPLSRKTTPGQRHPPIAPNERRSVSPKCGPSRLRVRSQRSDSPSARGRRGLVRERRDSVLATDLAHHRHKADGVGTAGTQKTRSMRHKERPIHRTHARLRRSVRPIGHLRANHASQTRPHPPRGGW